jgi:hypothetical protein
MNRTQLLGFAGALALACAAHAVPVVNGTVDAEYGPAFTVQTNPTSFGDSNLGQVGFANGSELDAGYAAIANGRLYIMLSGNLESNFNKVDLFIDSVAGGMNRLTPIPNNQGNFNAMADDGSGNGLTFDPVFAADHWIRMNGGGGTPDIFVDYAQLNPPSAGFFSGQTTPTNGTLVGGNGGPVIEGTWNNSNITGVTGTTAPNDAASVSTGMEFSISLADIGNPTGAIHISAFINGSGGDFLSSQVLGPVNNGGNHLGGPRTVNFNQHAGDQFFTIIVPEPASLGAIGMAAVAMLARRRGK